MEQRSPASYREEARRRMAGAPGAPPVEPSHRSRSKEEQWET